MHDKPGAIATRRRPASPRARRLARERGLDVESVIGAGGRLTVADIERAITLAAQSRSASVFHLQVTIDMTRLLPLVGPSSEWSLDAGVTYKDLLTKLCAVALRRSGLNAQLPDPKAFTVSDFGPHGVDACVAVLAPPQVAVLALGRVRPEVVAHDSDALEVRVVLTATLTCDARTLDGADGAEFLRTVKLLVEEPALAL